MNRVLLFLLLLLAFADSRSNGQVIVLTKDSLNSSTFDFGARWKFHEGDDPSMAAPDFDDTKWDLVNTALRYTSHVTRAEDTFSSIGWFRYTFIADTSTVGIPLALRVSQYGSSEIYLDGKKLISYGTIKSRNNSIYYDPQYLPFTFVIPTAGRHVMAVRYANYLAKRNYEREHRNLAGFHLSIGEAKSFIASDHKQSVVIPVVYALLFGFFIAFCMAHLFLYVFYRASVSNLYFSIFCLCLSAAFLISFLNRFSHNPKTAILNSFIGFIVLSVGCFSFSGFTNDLFSVRKTRFKVIAAVCAATPFIMMINGSVGGALSMVLLLVVFIEAIIITIRAIYRKVRGARIIGGGILFFTLFFLSNIIFVTIKGNDVVDSDTLGGQIYLVLIACAIVCMPIFMSIYLAWDFANINKNLKKQLQQVELLSAQTLAQEQEKKQILESQNENLEREVATRTGEVKKQHEDLKAEKKKSDDLLLNILPAEVAEELKENGFSKARLFDHVTVLFTDFVDFTNAGERMSPEELVNELHTCFKAFDEIISKYGIEKIKTIGDAYLAVCGLPEASGDHAAKVASAALDILQFMTGRKQQFGEKVFNIRIGIHSGSVVAGIVGIKKFAYDIWGDTVNTAARMEQNSEPGKINISQTTYDLVKGTFDCTYRGKIQAKNKGELSMYFINKVAQNTNN